MATPVLVTKLFVPPPRPNVVLRPRLIERLNAGLHRTLTLISAPAGFGKSTLVSEWVQGIGRPAAYRWTTRITPLRAFCFIWSPLFKRFGTTSEKR